MIPVYSFDKTSNHRPKHLFLGIGPFLSVFFFSFLHLKGIMTHFNFLQNQNQTETDPTCFLVVGLGWWFAASVLLRSYCNHIDPTTWCKDGGNRVVWL